MNTQPDLLVIAPPESRRVRAIQASLAARGWPGARVLSWLEVIGGEPLERHVKANTVVKLDSPGEDWATERKLLELGWDAPDPDGEYARVNPQGLEFERGALLASRQEHLGFCRALEIIRNQLAALGRRAMNHPDDIAVMFDKRATHARLAAAGVTVPPALPAVRSFEELESAMTVRGWRRVFVKLAHGSGAAGAIALETNGTQWQATTTVEMVSSGGNVRLYNTRRLWKHRDLHSVAALVNAVCAHRVQVERWLPKASFQGKTFDLRVVIVAGRARQVLVRSATGPITNLHLGNERGDWEALRAHLGETWTGVKQSCEASLAAFPNSLYGGVDALIGSDWARHAVLEVNAFGDYHRDVFFEGLDTYQTELEAWRERGGSCEQ